MCYAFEMVIGSNGRWKENSSVIVSTVQQICENGYWGCNHINGLCTRTGIPLLSPVKLYNFQTAANPFATLTGLLNKELEIIAKAESLTSPSFSLGQQSATAEISWSLTAPLTEGNGGGPDVDPIPEPATNCPPRHRFSRTGRCVSKAEMEKESN